MHPEITVGDEEDTISMDFIEEDNVESLVDRSNTLLKSMTLMHSGKDRMLQSQTMTYD